MSSEKEKEFSNGDVTDNAFGVKVNNEDVKKKEVSNVDLDAILSEVGSLGWFQLRTLLLMVVLEVFAGWQAEYVFTAGRIATRCRIPECESETETSEFSPPWLSLAVPTTDGTFDQCSRFNTSIFDENLTTCSATSFDQQNAIPCEEFVYQNTNTIVYDFGLACEEWRRTMVGSMRTIGTLVSLPVTGYISDRYGRRVAMAFNAFNTGWLGVLRYFTTSYNGFVTLEFFEGAFGAGVVSCVYILMLEIVGPRSRVLVSACLSTFFATGQVVLGAIAWALPHWRDLTLALYIPQLFTVFYFWIVTESIRWYMSKGRFEDAQKVLKKIARVNKRELSEKSARAVQMNVEVERRLKADKLVEEKKPWLIVTVFQHKAILLRCSITPVWWIAMTFIYYGLSINAVNMTGNQYANYMAVSAVEIPGFWTAGLLLGRVGRKPVLIAAFWVCAASQAAYLLLSEDAYALSLTVYLVGKYSIAVVVTSTYVYTAELFPTECRHRLFAFASMVGRLGSILAPLTPAFGAQLPFILFGSLALVAGLLALLTPETRGVRLPETIADMASATPTHTLRDTA